MNVGTFSARAPASTGGYQPPSPAKEKVYILDDQPFTPIEILPKAEGNSRHKKQKQTFLRDPGQTLLLQGGKLVTKKAAPSLPPQKTPMARKFVSKPLKFQRLTVKGYSKDPRVEFNDDPLDIKRSDEPLSRDFLSRTYMEERDL